MLDNNKKFINFIFFKFKFLTNKKIAKIPKKIIKNLDFIKYSTKKQHNNNDVKINLFLYLLNRNKNPGATK